MEKNKEKKIDVYVLHYAYLRRLLHCLVGSFCTTLFSCCLLPIVKMCAIFFSHHASSQPTLLAMAAPGCLVHVYFLSVTCVLFLNKKAYQGDVAMLSNDINAQ